MLMKAPQFETSCPPCWNSCCPRGRARPRWGRPHQAHHRRGRRVGRP